MNVIEKMLEIENKYSHLTGRLFRGEDGERISFIENPGLIMFKRTDTYIILLSEDTVYLLVKSDNTDKISTQPDITTIMGDVWFFDRTMDIVQIPVKTIEMGEVVRGLSEGEIELPSLNAIKDVNITPNYAIKALKNDNKRRLLFGRGALDAEVLPSGAIKLNSINPDDIIDGVYKIPNYITIINEDILKEVAIQSIKLEAKEMLYLGMLELNSTTQSITISSKLYLKEVYGIHGLNLNNIKIDLINAADFRDCIMYFPTVYTRFDNIVKYYDISSLDLSYMHFGNGIAAYRFNQIELVTIRVGKKFVLRPDILENGLGLLGFKSNKDDLRKLIIEIPEGYERDEDKNGLWRYFKYAREIREYKDN